MTDEHLIDCTVTYYQVAFPDGAPLGVLREIGRDESCGWHVRDAGAPKQPYLYLHNSAASAPLNDLIAGAREGRGWFAQAGAPPVYVVGEGWGGRNYPRIYIGAKALLALERVLSQQKGAP